MCINLRLTRGRGGGTFLDGRRWGRFSNRWFLLCYLHCGSSHLAGNIRGSWRREEEGREEGEREEKGGGRREEGGRRREEGRREGTIRLVVKLHHTNSQ